jgi:hypothetical protein
MVVDMHGSVSTSLWIYFVIMVPLTVLIVGTWWMFDQRSVANFEEDAKEAEAHMVKLEARIMEGIRRKTGAKVVTWPKQAEQMVTNP